MTNERRQHDRVQKEVQFCCYIDGQRFDSASVNISGGGAFLKTRDSIPPETVVVVVPKDHHIKQFPVMLVGKVLRRQEDAQGLGITWLRCVTRAGIRRLWQFIEAYPELWETIPPLPPREILANPCIGFDFITNQFFTPKGSGGAPANGGNGPARNRKPAPKNLPGGREPSDKTRPIRVIKETSAPAKEAIPVEPAPLPEDHGADERPDPHIARLAAAKAAGELPTVAREPSTTAYGRVITGGPEVIIPMSRVEVMAEAERLTRPKEPTPPPFPNEESRQRLENPLRLRKDRQPGALTQMIRKQEEEVPANIPVIFSYSGKDYEGTVRMISLNTLFVLTFDVVEEENAKVEVKLPVPLHSGSYPVSLSCRVLRSGKHVEVGGIGVHLNILAAYQGARPGVFERYVKYLYYQAVTRR
jgi:hypothetical protein